MVNDTNNEEQNNQTQNNNQSSNSNIGGSGHKYVVGIDTGGADDQGYMETVAKGLQDCGNEVVTTQVGPNQESYMAGKGADIGVFLCNGVGPATMWSFVNAIKAGTLPFTIFALEGWYSTDPNGTLASMENVRAVPFEPEWDAGQFMNSSSIAKMQEDSGGAKTIGEWADMNSQYFSLCWAKTPEEMAQNICSGSCGGGGSGTMANTNGGAQIKDKTFEQCIRRICAATDSIFIVENNIAVLFPYTDWLAFTLREKIQTINANEIDPNVFSIDYTTQGFYNKVTVAWGGNSLPERFPDNSLMHKKYIQQQEKQEKTTQSSTKKNGTTQTITADKDGTKLISEQYDALVEKYGVLEKRVQSAAPDLETAQYLVNALLIQYVRDFNHTCDCRAINNRRYIGGTFYIVTNPSTNEQEMLYLNGYTVVLQKDEPLYFDLEFKYGPESAEELLDLQTLTSGGSGGGSGSGTMGGEAASINELAKQAIGNETDPLQKATKVHEYLKQFIVYSYYSCSKDEWGKDPEKIWQAVKSGQGTNCADTANLTRAVMSAAGLDAVVVHGPNHFWTVVTINGKEYASDLTANTGQHSRRSLGEVYSNLSYYDKCGKTASC